MDYSDVAVSKKSLVNRIEDLSKSKPPFSYWVTHKLLQITHPSQYGYAKLQYTQYGLHQATYLMS